MKRQYLNSRKEKPDNQFYANLASIINYLNDKEDKKIDLTPTISKETLLELKKGFEKLTKLAEHIKINRKNVISKKEKENKYCCNKFKKKINDHGKNYNRGTTFEFCNGVWFTDFSDGEYGDIELTFCPFCGTKLEKPSFLVKYGWSWKK